MDDIEKRRKYQREFARAARAKRKALGIPPPVRPKKQLTPDEIAKRRARNRLSYEQNRSKRLEKNAEWRKGNAERHRQLVRQWAEANKEKMAGNTRKWRERNPERARAIARKNAAAIRSTPWGDITQKVFRSLRAGLRKRGVPASKYAAALGYTWVDLFVHIEKQFSPEMTWENWGSVWEMDHITPISAFRYQSLEDPLFRECWALSNLRPLPRLENRSKHNKRAAD